MAGRDTSRVARFGVSQARAQNIKQKERCQSAHGDVFDRLLLDPDECRLCDKLGDAHDTDESGADTTIAEVEQQLRKFNRESVAIEDQAGRDLNGNPVYRKADMDQDNTRPCSLRQLAASLFR